MTIELLLTILLFGFGLALPWAIGLWHRFRLRGQEGRGGPIGWRRMTHSALAYVLAFNLTFFLQELFLVLPKALVPGLQPTLYHNNHNWTGEAAIADLFQGTGALAILISGFICLTIVSRQERPSLLLLWLAFNGLFQSLPQFVVGAITAGNDTGQAFDYLAIGTAGEAEMAILALAAMAAAGIALGRQFLRTGGASQTGTARARFAYLGRIAGLPMLLAVPLIIPFRVPREAIEVLASPVLVPLLGFGWMQLAAVRAVHASGRELPPARLGPLVAATLVLLAIFQLILRPGIPF